MLSQLIGLLSSDDIFRMSTINPIRPLHLKGKLLSRLSNGQKAFLTLVDGLKIYDVWFFHLFMFLGESSIKTQEPKMAESCYLILASCYLSIILYMHSNQ